MRRLSFFDLFTFLTYVAQSRFFRLHIPLCPLNSHAPYIHTLQRESQFNQIKQQIDRQSSNDEKKNDSNGIKNRSQTERKKNPARLFGRARALSRTPTTRAYVKFQTEQDNRLGRHETNNL